MFLFCQMNVPLSMDEIPPLPEPEGSALKEQLKQVYYIYMFVFIEVIHSWVFISIYFKSVGFGKVKL